MMTFLVKIGKKFFLTIETKKIIKQSPFYSKLDFLSFTIPSSTYPSHNFDRVVHFSPFRPNKKFSLNTQILRSRLMNQLHSLLKIWTRNQFGDETQKFTKSHSQEKFYPLLSNF